MVQENLCSLYFYVRVLFEFVQRIRDSFLNYTEVSWIMKTMRKFLSRTRKSIQKVCAIHKTLMALCKLVRSFYLDGIKEGDDVLQSTMESE